MDITKERVEQLIEGLEILQKIAREKGWDDDLQDTTDTIAILREKAEQIKAGEAEKISGSQNDASRPAPRHASPGLSPEDERAWIEGGYISLGHAAGMCEPGSDDEKWLRAEQAIVAHIRRTLSPADSKGGTGKRKGKVKP